MAVGRVGVVGCGLMGSGIAQVAAAKGFPTVVLEASDALLQKGLGRIRAFLDKGVEKGKLTPADRDALLGRIRGTTGFEDLAGVDLAIEAVTEDAAAKRAVYESLARVLPPQAIVATNTSSLSVTGLAAATGRPDRFLGLHFFNPVPLMPLVEIVRGLRTSEPTHAATVDFVRALGKESIQAKDTPGFVVNFLLVPYVLGAVRALEAGVASRDDIDKGMTLGAGHPMGPLRLLDLVGLDTTLAIADVFVREFGDPRYAAPPLLRRMVEAGWFGEKSGRGFYEYAPKAPAGGVAVAGSVAAGVATAAAKGGA
jgi:3-hydroxybutyryl-CoA dehydrogenase